jgi:hypothetical protein
MPFMRESGKLDRDAKAAKVNETEAGYLALLGAKMTLLCDGRTALELAILRFRGFDVVCGL